ncbi:GlxA family transcriptional regulator [Planobispora takensis]|uniref:AraC family transcriptional regulator n=1 Tax=Planobispora takensis TaxID=1367882 RepID=A0A8J3WYT4_9ACTN|nr:helix-turn-helix domain-containing protein [Planobispora takensis]GII04117.1 AraC family transcriptional regulator [Planobispora takensis]
MHVVGVLAMNGVVAFDMTVPAQVFGSSTGDRYQPLYETRVCTVGGAVRTSEPFGAMRLETAWDLDDFAAADTLVLPGHWNFLQEPPGDVLEAVRAAAGRGARIASICAGAFLLAATGLLDGRRATTHWTYAAELARRHPAVEVDASVLFTDNGDLLTSAGVAAGIDLCLHLVRRDHGSAVAAETARRIVMSPQRDGGQAQFIRHADPRDPGTALQPVLTWMESNLHRPLSLGDIARHACLSVRTLTRRFRAQIGTTPLQWLLNARIRRAQHLLESTDLPIGRIAEAVGMGSPATLRAHFARAVGTSPQTYRATFRARP